MTELPNWNWENEKFSIFFKWEWEKERGVRAQLGQSYGILGKAIKFYLFG